MKRYKVLLVLLVTTAVAVFFAVVVDRNSAAAYPSQTSICLVCHTSSPLVAIDVSVFSQTDTEITYQVSGSTAYSGIEAWGAFDASTFTKVAGGTGIGTFTVPKDGAAYSLFWVDNQVGTTMGYARFEVQTPLPTTTTTQATTTTTSGTTTTTTSGGTTTTVGATTSTTAPATTTTTLPTGTLPVTG